LLGHTYLGRLYLELQVELEVSLYSTMHMHSTDYSVARCPSAERRWGIKKSRTSTNILLCLGNTQDRAIVTLKSQ